MRKTLLAISIFGTMGLATADYSIITPLEAAKGGSLPNGSIIFTNQTQEPPAPIENWVATSPLYTDWVNDGEPFNCTDWTPDPSTVALGEIFTQTASDCEQQQTRTRQDREQETTTLAVRDVGFPVYENQTIAATDTREAEGTLDPWEAFADANSLSKDWNNLNWVSKSLSGLPDSPYPIDNPNTIDLKFNQLASINSLSNLQSVNMLLLSSNQLTNVNALVNLSTVGTLALAGNPIVNISGISNAQVSNYIYINNTYAGPKLAATTRFCTLNAPERFPAGFAQKSQLCQDPWETFADANSLSKDWSFLDWSFRAIPELPDAPYPINNPSMLNLSFNQLKNVDELASITHVGSRIDLSVNQLTNVDGLINIQSSPNLYLNSNQLTNINGLSNMAVPMQIRIDATYAGPKLAATTRFCSQNAAARFQAGYAQKSQLCNP